VLLVLVMRFLPQGLIDLLTGKKAAKAHYV